MCGILCCISKNGSMGEDEMINRCEHLIHRRGPNFKDKCSLTLSNGWNGYFCASVLKTRGSKLQIQPCIIDNNILLWNGDIFKSQLILEDDRSDTLIIAEWLAAEVGHNSFSSLVSIIQGPYAFIYYNFGNGTLWFGRDPIGRHSLLWRLEKDRIVLSSCACRNSNTTEVPAVGIFSINFHENYSLNVMPWSHLKMEYVSKFVPPNAVFSGEICHPSFANKPDVAPGSNFFELSLARTNSPLDFVKYCLEDENVSSRVRAFKKILLEAVESRIGKAVQKSCDCRYECPHCQTAILFSGGLDSAVIAAMVDDFIPKWESVDLINVAFKCRGEGLEAPDRRTGVETLQELKALNPHRCWNFVQVDVTEEELLDARNNRINDLIYPMNSVIDDSLGCALWFAARGVGTMDGHPYKSPAKIILSGLGADEQLGGYTRHRNLLKREGWQALQNQLQAETRDIWTRNLGRDDRVACDHGRQIRFPYLDENVVQFLNSLPASKKCCPTTTLPPGFGDKLLLRLVACTLGLVHCAHFPKRAFQFGSRIADSKEKGSDVCPRLL